MPWTVRDGRIHTQRLEVNIVHHCNLSCRGCSHLSPQVPTAFVSPARLSEDLTILARYCRPERISLLGGEPLLHPALLEIVDVVRRSNISDTIRVVTNGVRLGQMTAAFWKHVDEVHVSLYPGHTMTAGDLAACRRLAKANGSRLTLRYQEYFLEPFTEVGIADDALVRRVYATCTSPREDGCHTLCDGCYYKCAQAAFIPLGLRDRFDFGAVHDGVVVRDDPGFVAELVRYLSDDEPLTACRFCLGTVGRRFTPVQVSRRGELRHATTNELIDWRHLERLERRRATAAGRWLRESGQLLTRLLSALPPSVQLSRPARWSMRAAKAFARRHARWTG